MNTNAWVSYEIVDNNLEGCQPPTVQPTSRALSDGSRAETPVPIYKHKWTVQQRITLEMLGSSYMNHWDDLTRVFNCFHRSDLPRCGGLRSPVVRTQYYDMRHKFNAETALRDLKVTLSPYDRAKLASRAHLEQRAQKIGIQLIAKMPGTSSQNNMTYNHVTLRRNKRKRGDSDDSRTDYLPSRTDKEDRTAFDNESIPDLTHLLRTPTKPYSPHQPYGLLTPPTKRHIPEITINKRLASIGFRAFTAKSQGTYSSALGIRAGAFLNCLDIPLARDLSVTKYREEALHHVTKHDHSRASMFISATKNPMRALHMLLHAPHGEHGLILIDLKAADENGNVEKAFDLKLRTPFRYSAASEYLIFGGVDPKAIISYIPLPKLLSNMRTTPNDDDPFKIEVLRAHERLSYARSVIKKNVPPMTYSLGKAVGKLVETLCVPSKHFESAVWAFVQDYKFYKCEGGKRGHWADNTAFKDGAVQGYQALQSNRLASLEIEESIQVAREIIEITDDDESDQASDSDLASSYEDALIPVGIDDWIRNTQASQAFPQYYNLETGKWMNKKQDLGHEFMTELRGVVGHLDSNKPKIDHNNPAEMDMEISQSAHQDGNPGFGGIRMQVDHEPVTAPAGILPEEYKNLNELCADVMNMHGDEHVALVKAKHDMDIDYEFCWTGM